MKEKKLKDREKKAQELNMRKQLTNVRVIQRNLVYVTNLALSVAKEEVFFFLFLCWFPVGDRPSSFFFAQILRRHEYFGQYGRIQKIVVNKTNLYNSTLPNGPSVSAYITFYKKEDASRAIQAVDGAWLENRVIR
jgi:CCR4-NOT transcription complex subunit 4